ncbi:MAG: hypothetical protein ACYCTY_11235 [Sulfuricella sp.]
MVNNYRQYQLEFTKEWACKISQRAGCEHGKGGRGKKEKPLEMLTCSLSVSYDTWQKYKAGKQVPNAGQMARIHSRAIKLGYIGRGQSGLLKRIKDRAELMSPDEWWFWSRYEANPSFQVEDQEQELYEKALDLEQQAAALLREACGIRHALAVFLPQFCHNN